MCVPTGGTYQGTSLVVLNAVDPDKVWELQSDCHWVEITWSGVTAVI